MAYIDEITADDSLSELFDVEPDRTIGLSHRPVHTESRVIAVEVDGYTRYHTVEIYSNRPASGTPPF